MLRWSWDEDIRQAKDIRQALNEDIRQAKRRRKAKWCEKWLLKRDLKVNFNNFRQELRLESKLFKKYLRMKIPTFDFILKRIRPLIQKELYLISGVIYSRLQF